MALSAEDIRDRRCQRLADEVGAVTKPWHDQTKVALIYPNTYYHAMSNLGFQAVYHGIQQRDDCWCERFFLPDRDEVDFYHNNHLLSLESQLPLRDFDVVMFSLSFENDYLNLPILARMTRMPLWRQERDAEAPLFVAGGICAMLNPEPVAEFIDVFVIGESEVLLTPLLDTLNQGLSRDDVLDALVRQPGFYCPAYYQPHYDDNGQRTGVDVREPAPERVRRQWLADLNTSDCRSFILTPHTAFGTMHLHEVSRGCSRGCRFCATGFTYLPPREKSAGILCSQILPDLVAQETAGLVGAAVSDYSHLEHVSQSIRDHGGHVSVASLRIDSLTRDEVAALRDGGQKTLALAPEAGSQRMRDLINKNLTEEQILAAVGLLAEEGILNLKLYFLIGLPDEQVEDLDAFIDLIKTIRQLWVEKQKPFGRLGTITVSVNPFIPKPTTPFQWCAMDTQASLKKKVTQLRKAINRLANVQLQVESLRSAELQALLAIGDRQVAHLLPLLADGMNLKAACRNRCVDLNQLVHQPRRREDLLPWGVIDSGVNTDYLWNDYQRSLLGQLTAPCHRACTRCGVCHAQKEENV
ncbi:radical SAM protein [Desulfuromonas acetoxidans]|uniref:Radical SAM n=1 Tax=Desulfuromonas acetoxidans (strain DSM 684 / 11070) TaxID=281689 RepID=Q1JXC2_DESA6|nr:radical SAM protein [Desulfuromonas acetoxidans]EAT14870.1 Radical SAM [Desulfuromonas acetoxidans DSM 684]MBF0646838.1 radical SAM protein [Desulfuromonas acetoxidans]NVD23330.1 radical SAM protein [Desulfuromonas acetoxidans]NVE15429.1 radical SAM protein [Desulfuromonas acetoxidans]